MLNKKIIMLLCFFTFFIIKCNPITKQKITKSIKNSTVNIEYDKKNKYFKVLFDYTSGISRREMGRNYGKEIIKLYGKTIESGYASYIEKQPHYKKYMQRVKYIKPQLPQIFRDEIEGLASNFSGGDIDKKDGKLSINEIYFLNLSHGILQRNRCSGFSVYGNRSYSGKTMTSWTLDWHHGSAAPTIFTIKNGEKSMLLIGNLLNINGYGGLNKKGLFFSILGSQSGEKYPSDIKKPKYRSHVMDTRYA